MKALFGVKQGQTQVFLEDGTRVPVTVVSVPETTVTQLKDSEKDSYKAVQVGFGTAKKGKKSTLGHIKKSNLKVSPRYLREVRFSESEDLSAYSLGAKVSIEEVFKPGDLVLAQGISKGKGFAGGVKRHGFRGGPKTHGQSDRHRAPGAIGQGTTPGRVYKGKRMAGRMGQDQVTVKNLFIVDVKGSDLYVSGLIPGSKNSVLRIEKIGEKKNFVPVFDPEKKADTPEEVVEAVQEVPVESQEQQAEEVKTETRAEESSQKEDEVEAKPADGPEQKPVEESLEEDKKEEEDAKAS